MFVNESSGHVQTAQLCPVTRLTRVTLSAARTPSSVNVNRNVKRLKKAAELMGASHSE